MLRSFSLPPSPTTSDVASVAHAREDSQASVGLSSTETMMAELQRRRRRRELGGGTASDGGAAAAAPAAERGDGDGLFLKLSAAGFYGVSSFLIVVVNKSVLTSYR